MELVNHVQTRRLLRGKFVVVLGDSIQRSVYKDIVLLLQKDQFLSLQQLKSKGELSFEHDVLLDGGQMDQMHNGTNYREVREFRTHWHHVRFYFLTRVYSPYVRSILDVFHRGPKPDMVIVNSCLWDISRYENGLQEYAVNLDWFFGGLRAVLPPWSLVVWTLTMPVSQTPRAGFLQNAFQHPLEWRVFRANQFSLDRAAWHNVSVLDLYNRFTDRLWHRMEDGVHWDPLAHRTITTLILERADMRWGDAGDDFWPDDFWLDDFPPFGGIHVHMPGFHDNVEPKELPSPPVDVSPPSLPSSMGSTTETDGVGGGVDGVAAGTGSVAAGMDGVGGGTDGVADAVAAGTEDSLKPTSTSTSTAVSGERSADKTDETKEEGSEKTDVEQNEVLKTVSIKECSKREQNASGGNAARDAEPSGSQHHHHLHHLHLYDYDEFTQDSVTMTTHHHFIPGYVSFDQKDDVGGVITPSPPKHHHHHHHRHRQPAHHGAMAAVHGSRYSPYCLPPHLITSSQRRRNNRQQNNSYVMRNRRANKRLH